MRGLRWQLAFSAWASLAITLIYWLLLRVIGERWWLGTVALYFPHLLALVPLLLLLPLLAVVGPRRLLPVPLLAILVWLFPVMGVELPSSAAVDANSADKAARLRVLSYNVDSGRRSETLLIGQIVEAEPDIIVIQEGVEAVVIRAATYFPGYYRQLHEEYALLSRYPISSVQVAPRIMVAGAEHSARFVRYTLETPLGPVDLFNVHPVSPRDGFDHTRGDGLLTGVQSGELFRTDMKPVNANALLRRAQIEAAYRSAQQSRNPVIIAGDTNLPANSKILADTIGHLQDGFSAAGWGAGYTFPADKYFAWMRIDRVLAGPEFRFVDFQVGAGKGSDHYCVWADLERRR